MAEGWEPQGLGTNGTLPGSKHDNEGERWDGSGLVVLPKPVTIQGGGLQKGGGLHLALGY
jgi:hypothetical protein